MTTAKSVEQTPKRQPHWDNTKRADFFFGKTILGVVEQWKAFAAKEKNRTGL